MYKRQVGDYIVFIDGDDKVHPDMFARCIEYMETSLCDVIQFDYVEVKTEETIDNNILGSIDKVKIFSSKEAIYQLYGESEVEKFNFLLWNKICLLYTSLEAENILNNGIFSFVVK